MDIAKPIDPEIAPFAAQFGAEMNVPDVSVSEWRRRYAALLAQQGEPKTPVATQDITIPTRHGPMQARLYAPDNPQPALLVYMHGGGFVVGDLDSLEVPLHTLSHDAGISVLSLDYALAPENMYPVAFEQCQDALTWVERTRAELGDPRRLGVGGDSAGGNFAALLALWARDNNGPELDWQVLINPVLDFTAVNTSATESHRLYGDSPMLSTEAMKVFQLSYFKDQQSQADSSPLLFQDLSGLPPAFIAAGECDALRDDSIAYAEKLAAKGIPAELIVYEGMTHNFIVLTHLSATSRQFLTDLTAAASAWAQS